MSDSIAYVLNILLLENSVVTVENMVRDGICHASVDCFP